MNITLKSLKTCAKLSEETRFFHCTVCIDGKPVCLAHNSGTGGCNVYTPIDNTGYLKIRQAEEFAKKKLNVDYEPLDVLIEILIYELEISRTLKRYFKANKVVAICNDAMISSSPAKSAVDSLSIRAYIAKKHPGSTILNDMEFDAAIQFACAAMSHRKSEAEGSHSAT